MRNATATLGGEVVSPPIGKALAFHALARVVAQRDDRSPLVGVESVARRALVLDQRLVHAGAMDIAAVRGADFADQPLAK